MQEPLLVLHVEGVELRRLAVALDTLGDHGQAQPVDQTDHPAHEPREPRVAREPPDEGPVELEPSSGSSAR